MNVKSTFIPVPLSFQDFNLVGYEPVFLLLLLLLLKRERENLTLHITRCSAFFFFFVYEDKVPSWRSAHNVANTATGTRYVCAHDVRRRVTAHVTARRVTGYVIRSHAAREMELVLRLNKQVRADTGL